MWWAEGRERERAGGIGRGQKVERKGRGQVEREG